MKNNIENEDRSEFKLKTDDRSGTLLVKSVGLLLIPIIALFFIIRCKENESFSEWMDYDYPAYAASFLLQGIMYTIIAIKLQGICC